MRDSGRKLVRRESEERLSAGDRLFRTAMQNSAIGMALVAPSGRLIEVNKRFGEFLGYSPEELAALDFQRITHPEDLAADIGLLKRVLSGDIDHYEIEKRYIRKDGAAVWGLLAVSLLRNEAGEPEFFVSQIVDIDSRKRSDEALRVMNERVTLAVEAGEIGIWEFSVREDRISWDSRMYALYDVGPGSFSGTREEWRSYLHPDDIDQTIRLFDEAIATRGRFDCEYRIVRKDGAVRYMRSLAQVLVDAEGRADRIIGTHWDTTEQRLLTRQLFDEKERLRITLYSIGDAVITTDQEANITFMNPVAEKVTGWSRPEAEGLPLSAIFRLVDETTGRSVPSPVDESLRRGQPCHLQDGVSLIARDGTLLSIQDSAAPVRGPDGVVHGAVLVFQDVSHTRKLQRELAYSALHDALTDLPNRRSFEQSLTAACDDAGESGATHVLGYLDLDRFKLINDTAGHAAGDTALRDVARLLRAAIRKGDMLARIGGDEFGFILYNCKLEQARQICEQIILMVRGMAFRSADRTYDLGASIGVAAISERRRDPVELMKEADIACYAAKSSGRNRVSLYEPTSSETARYRRDIDIAASLRDAIENDRFTLFAQKIVPLVEPRSGKGMYEIFVRLRGDDGALISPAVFIPAAERYNLMSSIDRWIIGNALGRHGPLLQSHPHLTFSLNLSANSLGDPSLWPFVEGQIRISGIDPGRLTFEITETALITNVGLAIDFVKKAQDFGVRISLDDFGVGLSSFAYLKVFQADLIKIDASFVKDAPHVERDRQIVRAIVELGKSMGIGTVAEGVETKEILDVVTDLGVAMAQGYYFGLPMPIEEVLAQNDSGAAVAADIGG